ncbi:MAG TPA: gliding motility-associated lipoprotein [Flavobacteriales bacterium]|jgi:formylglycine-generating enzyme required for sulfatase activity|nr:gliding motility-associated lipoprotein [Flavobacteriales bacterium]|tara:strand:- start:6716 stop:8080 length:1365 start_codon:yes stop_codon:yes gene_type:complete
MKNILLILITAAALFSCTAGPQGELVGVYPREQWIQVNPYGMNYIHLGSYTMGPSDQDVPFAMNTRSKTVTMPAFYIDVHEISNNEYRQFCEWVKDSLYRNTLAEDDNEDYFFAETEDGIELDRFIDKGYILNWETPIDWEDEDIFDLLYDEYFLQGSDQYYNRRQYDTRKLNYRYWWLNFDAAASKESRDSEYSETNSLNQLHSVRGHSDRSQFVVEETINIFPDTLVWVRDFTYGFNEPLADYFWHPAYDNYPVVGVTWSQAKAFNAWRTQLMNNWRNSNGQSDVQRFRLPTEAEWEYAARGGLELSPFPWGGPYMRNAQGCPLANFKPMRGDYVEDGGAYTVDISSYSPNDYGLYNMAGNVAEWTSTAYDETVYEFSHELSPEYTYHAKVTDPPALHRKVTRGGSWKDIGYYCQTGTRSFEYRDTSKAYIGFRSVMSYMGRGKSGDPEEWN